MGVFLHWSKRTYYENFMNQSRLSTNWNLIDSSDFTGYAHATGWFLNTNVNLDWWFQYLLLGSNFRASLWCKVVRRSTGGNCVPVTRRNNRIFPTTVIVITDSPELCYTLLSIRGVRNSMNKYTRMNPLRTTSPTIFSNSNPAKE